MKMRSQGDWVYVTVGNAEAKSDGIHFEEVSKDYGDDINYRKDLSQAFTILAKKEIADTDPGDQRAREDTEQSKPRCSKELLKLHSDLFVQVVAERDSFTEYRDWAEEADNHPIYTNMGSAANLLDLIAKEELLHAMLIDSIVESIEEHCGMKEDK
jgi:hypothetical protein